MTSVRQTDFREALLDPTHAAPDGLLSRQGRPADRRYNVYRNNVVASLTTALHEGFPAISRLLGKQNMDGVAGLYLRRFPPTSPILSAYGADFGAFLDTLPQITHLPYLGDVARLEWLLLRAYHAEDTPAIDPSTLAAMSADAFDTAHLRFAPSLGLLASKWPVHEIWSYATQENAPKPDGHAQTVLILRRNFDPEIHPLGGGDAAFITSAGAGDTLQTALACANQSDPRFDLSALLSLLLGAGAITHITKGDTE